MYFAAFHQFLDGIAVELRHIILEQLITRLMEIKTWFTIQRLYKFIGSSILIVYEGDSEQIKSATNTSDSHERYLKQTDTVADLNIIQRPALKKGCQQELCSNSTLVETRIIDTAHVFASSDVDSNYMFGLENVISIVEKMQKNLYK